MELWYSSMYKALKTAQTEVNESLLKLVDSISEVSELRGTLLVADSKNKTNPESDQIQQLIDTVGFLHQKQNAQFNSLVTELKNVNESMATMMRMLITQASSIQTSSTIPNIQPTSQDSDMKAVCVDTILNSSENVSVVSDVEEDDDLDEQDVDLDEQDELNTAVLDIEHAEGTEAEAEVEVAEAEVEAAEEEAELEVEEEGVEVEEWTYKGRVFFKDSENTVYANNSGEIGDPIGQYDPVKNIVKPLKK